MNGETIAMIKALQVKSIEELKTSGGTADAKVVGDAISALNVENKE